MARKVMVNGLDIGYIPPSAAADVVYNNTTSGLTATDVQEAVDELAARPVVAAAADVTYDNTVSGLTANNAQDAIDEVASLATGQTLIATSPANTTFGSQLASLQTAYSALSDLQKGRAYLLIDDNFAHVYQKNIGRFTYMAIPQAGRINLMGFDIVNAKAFESAITTTASTTEMTNSNHTGTIALYA